ncbi:glycosyltransferase family 2 protein [Mordavella massiliensis]|uniref:Glycosyltransferase n=1 Tax=Mordavella massiliensis TaxID=1871024 RepID=A0A938XC62_9CLOT|nr:glycosyltransferase [Mordavella massiliensis]MBM6948813.1 glycosyltransferase [Mordavella massiliensis]
MLKRCLVALEILFRYGICSLIRQISNKKYNKSIAESKIQTIHLVDKHVLNTQRKTIFNNNIKISIITPLYNTPSNYLVELIQSLQNQTYSNWELCFADGSDENHKYVNEICEKWRKKDSRIVYKKLDENLGISHNTNECLKLASGDYLGLLDHDDILHPSALYEIVRVIEREKADFIYTDEVKFKDNIEHIVNPLAFNLKPGFSKYDLRAHNYICHFTVFNKCLLQGEKDLYRTEYDGSQDHDMVLRLTEKANKIVHIPKVLYYWRIHENSVSLNIGVKPYAVDAGLRAVEAQLQRNKEPGEVYSAPPFQTLYNVNYRFAYDRVSIIIYNTQDKQEITNCIEKISSNTEYPCMEIIYWCKYKVSINDSRITLINLGNVYEFSRSIMWNLGTDKATGKYILLLNSNCRPQTKNWISSMVMLAQKEDVCTVGPKICYRDQTIAYAGLSYYRKLVLLCQHNMSNDIGYEALLCHVRKTMSTISACMMFKKETWSLIGGFSDKYTGLEEVEFCLRGARMNKVSLWTSFSKVIYQKSKIFCLSNKRITEKLCEDFPEEMGNDETYHELWNELRLV